jgi:Dyp-type peroxidase family
MGARTAGLRVERIQGNVFPGFNKDAQAFLWLRFPSADSARAWLRETVREVTSARDVLAFRALRRELAGRSAADAPRSTWVNVAFSRAGLGLLAALPPGAFPDAFEQGMAERAGRLGDLPPTWRFGGTPETEAHALVIVGADTDPDLLGALAVQRERLARHGGRDLFLEILGEDCHGAKLPGAMRGHEHFGYRDGISELDLAGAAGTGSFVLGYPDGTGTTLPSGPPWTRDGSYLVFRRLRQDVAGFHRALTALANRAGLKNGAQLGAKVVGRWPSGAKLADPIEPGDPGAAAPREYTAAEFAEDPNGERVPRFAHVRKARPRDVGAVDGHRPRLLRRGIPYGTPLTARASDGRLHDDGRDRGLLFLAYQADLTGQYEQVQRWMNDRSFPAGDTGQDPIGGQGENPARLLLRQSNTLPGEFDMQHYVSMTGGGYFFAPSLSAVHYLADPTRTWEQWEVVMADMAHQLGDTIVKENPYGAMSDVNIAGVAKSGLGKNKGNGDFFTNRDLTGRPEYWHGFFWTVGAKDGHTETVRVSKAIRIPYTIDGVKYNLVVGYEGAGGM